MKIILLLITLSSFFIKANGQNRWMYLSKSDNGTIFLVDTVSDDIKQLSEFDSHENVVTFWVTAYKSVNGKNGKYIQRTVEKIAVDTTNRQYEIKSSTKYKGKEVVSDNNEDYQNWSEVIPDTMGEDLINFAKSLNNFRIKWKLRFNALGQYNPYETKKRNR